MTNKVTLEHVQGLIDNSTFEEVVTHDKVYILSCKLPNGFVVTESSGCIDPANFNKEIGKDICLNRIASKVFELEGYLLQNELKKIITE